MLIGPQKIEVTVPAGKIHLHRITKERWRTSDGIKHEVVVIRMSPAEGHDQWDSCQPV